MTFTHRRRTLVDTREDWRAPGCNTACRLALYSHARCVTVPIDLQLMRAVKCREGIELDSKPMSTIHKVRKG